MLQAWRLATGLLTIFPVKPPTEITTATARTAMVLAPVAVAPLALISALVGWGAVLIGLPSVLPGVVVIGVLTLGTRAMHLDGLADTVDGLGSGQDRDRALAIMKAGDVGPMGVTALVLVLGAQVLAASALLTQPWGWVLLAMLLVMSRAALVIGCGAGVAAARPDGLGALVAGSVPVPVAVAEWLIIGGLVTVAGQVAGKPFWLVSVAAGLAALVVLGLLRLEIKRFGGITGDVLGALVEVAATTLLVVCSITAPQGLVG
jgi:adenosylcobinamide-GDP ribazoletransferase